ncbi:hypothetical protein OAB56_03025 [Gammaproteobacteria bacterium]|jgi:hypothetical protein|nr:hypothetical protein [Gammaproteobacteria bacterium]|tara:strand:+ start:351 stop:971 length:621 start_codon:yes stop_codon:yes gene_type:complete
MKKLLSTFILCCLLLLAACEQSMILETNLDIPQPIDITLPLNIAIFYEKSLREYVYTENSDDRRNWAITIGPSQIAIFDKVLPSIFSSIEIINNLDEAKYQDYDAVIVPEIKNIQFALPYETKTKIHETWIKYIIHIQEADGEFITDLNLTGYGKSQPNTSIDFLLDEREGLVISTNEAYRDLAAKIILSFQSDLTIKKWLDARFK